MIHWVAESPLTQPPVSSPGLAWPSLTGVVLLSAMVARGALAQ